MSIVTWLLAVIILLVIGLILYARTRPDQLHVERSIDIDAAPDVIFPLINDLHRWIEWSPYNKDPNMKTTFSGSESGPGARYAWSGDKNVGEGEIAIRETTPPNRLVFDLHMIKPFEGRNVAGFALTPSGNRTRVTWSLDDRHKLMHKLMSVFLNLDRMIGKDFEVGLANLKAVCEKPQA